MPEGPACMRRPYKGCQGARLALTLTLSHTHLPHCATVHLMGGCQQALEATGAPAAAPWGVSPSRALPPL